MPSLADPRLSPSHSWRHRLHDEFRRLKERTDIEDAIIGHASEGSGPGYGEYAIIDMLGPAIEKTRSPFDVVEGKPDLAVRADGGYTVPPREWEPIGN
jgi:hypothetical protein